MVDACLFDEDARSRCEAANFILIDLWPIMQRCFDALRDKKQQAQNQQNGSQQQNQNAGDGASGQSAPSGQQGSDDAKAAGKQAMEQALSEQRPETAPNFQGRTAACPSTGSFVPDKDQQKTVRAQIERVLSEETERIAAHVTGEITGNDGKGTVTANTEYEGNGYEYAASDIERLLEEMAERIVDEHMEEELSEELQREADSIRYGNAHRGISVTVKYYWAYEQYGIWGLTARFLVRFKDLLLTGEYQPTWYL